MRFDLFLLGAVRYQVAAGDAPALFETLQAQGLSPKRLKRHKKSGMVCFFLSYKHAADFERSAFARTLALSRKEVGGRVLAKRLLRAPGLLVGILLSLLLVLGARAVVWDVRVTGAQTIDEVQVLQSLENLGVFRGALLHRLEPDEIALALRQSEARVGYAAVNIKGTVVSVQIRETEPVPAQIPKKPANLVAARDGVVTMPLIFEGECLVAPGEVVRAGQILAGGILDTQNHGYRTTRAAGQVLARTVQTYTLRVPFSYEEKVYTGEERHALALLFFHRAHNFFKNTVQNIDDCDIIEEVRWLRTPAGAMLPFGYQLTTVSPYEMQVRTRTLQEARRLAEAQLQQALAADSAGRTLLEKHVEWCVDGDGVTLICTVVCEEDIARTVEFVLQP